MSLTLTVSLTEADSLSKNRSRIAVTADPDEQSENTHLSAPEVHHSCVILLGGLQETQIYTGGVGTLVLTGWGEHGTVRAATGPHQVIHK